MAEPPETEERKSKEETEENHKTGEGVAQDAKTPSGKSEESSLKPEDLIVGPLPAEELEFEERAKKLESIRKAEALKIAEETRKKEELQCSNTFAKRSALWPAGNAGGSVRKILLMFLQPSIHTISGLVLFLSDAERRFLKIMNRDACT